jgi:hypothetical protein
LVKPFALNLPQATSNFLKNDNSPHSGGSGFCGFGFGLACTDSSPNSQFLFLCGSGRSSVRNHHPGSSFAYSSAVIGGQTYPILARDLGVRYQESMNNLSVTGLLDLGLSNEYTTIDGQVFPILSYRVGEADTEHIIIPNLATVSFII